MSIHQTASAIQTLLTREKATGKITGVLATGWEWSDDYLTVTFTLRKGVKFHDGSDFNAHVVKWNWDRLVPAGAKGAEKVESYEVVDDYTFRVHLKTYHCAWLDRLCGGLFGTLGCVISQAAVEKNGEEAMLWTPIGTGPYKFKEYVRDQHMAFERFDGYWGGKPYLDGLRYVYIIDNTTSEMAFKAGELDAWRVTDFRTLDSLLSIGYKVDWGWGAGQWLMPSGGKPASYFSDIRVREAVEYAINKEKIVNSIYLGYATPLYQLCNAAYPEYNPDFVGRRYDPDKARQLLKDAGHPDGFTTNFYIATIFNGDHILAIQADLKAVGINTKIQVLQPGAWQEIETYGWDDGFDISLQGWSSFPEDIFRFWPTPQKPNWSSGLWWDSVYRPAGIDDYIESYITNPDEKERAAIAKEFLMLLYDNACGVPLWESQDATLMQPYIMDSYFNVLTSTGSGPIFDTVWINK
jgi:peptide/nickel transport system substrate-binding protein